MRARVGVVDLVAAKPSRSVYDRLMYPNFVSITPQAIAAWAEELGHDVHYSIYTGFEDLDRELPDDVDIVFLSAFTHAAYLAYAISHRLRKRGVVTVLGGPHARAYPADARLFFDYVAGFIDKPLIRDLLTGFARHGIPGVEEGVQISAAQQPRDLPGVRQRWKFARHALDKTVFVGVVPMIGSLGCPYRCSFCVDSTVAYQPLPTDQIREDLLFLQRALRRPVVGWHDPNFGVRFDDYLGVIEDTVAPGRVHFIAESSLSILTEPHLRELQRHRFGGLTVGIESWFDFNDKARQQTRGLQKVDAVAEHVDLITRYVPYVQTNFVWGLDQDEGPASFELTKRFIDRAPAAYPVHSLYTAYGDSAPESTTLRAEGRVLDAPFHQQDTSSIHNVALKSFETPQFYDGLADLVRHSFGPRPGVRRFWKSPHPFTSFARWMVLVRSITQAWRIEHFSMLRDRFASDPEYQTFDNPAVSASPRALRARVAQDLGPFYEELPDVVLDYLEGRCARELPRQPRADGDT